MRACSALLLRYRADRGQFSCEVILHLFGLKLRYPDKVHLIRGNHECSSVSPGARRPGRHGVRRYIEDPFACHVSVSGSMVRLHVMYLWVDLRFLSSVRPCQVFVGKHALVSTLQVFVGKFSDFHPSAFAVC